MRFRSYLEIEKCFFKARHSCKMFLEEKRYQYGDLILMCSIRKVMPIRVLSRYDVGRRVNLGSTEVPNPPRLARPRQPYNTSVVRLK